MMRGPASTAHFEPAHRPNQLAHNSYGPAAVRSGQPLNALSKYNGQVTIGSLQSAYGTATHFADGTP